MGARAVLTYSSHSIIVEMTIIGSHHNQNTALALEAREYGTPPTHDNFCDSHTKLA